MTTRGQEQKDREGCFDDKRVEALSSLPQEFLIYEILAVIHRDGGHYAEDHGLIKAVADGELKVLEAYHFRDAALAAVEGEVSAEEFRDSLLDELNDFHVWPGTYAKMDALILQDRARVAAKLRAENEELQKKWEAAVQVYTDESIKVGVLEDEAESLRERVRELEGEPKDFQNHKSGDVYEVLGVVENATNSCSVEQAVMIHYRLKGTPFGRSYVRESGEFHAKFSPVDSTNQTNVSQTPTVEDTANEPHV